VVLHSVGVRRLPGVGGAYDARCMPVLLLTRSTSVHDAVVPLCAAAGVGAEVSAEPALVLGAWAAADLVLVGCDVVEEVVALAPPRRAGVHVVGLAPDDGVFRSALVLGASSVIDLPSASGWLVDALADVGERASPGRVVGVVGGAGGAGATTLACALAQSHATRAPTLLVDTDPLGPGLDRLLGVEDCAGVR
jgi:secretion/DNA translocation related CpaE-like protein